MTIQFQLEKHVGSGLTTSSPKSNQLYRKYLDDLYWLVVGVLQLAL